MRLVPRLVLPLLAGVLSIAPAEAGHEFPFYPSFYPQEITLEVMPPAVAAARLQKKSLHAYLGPDPFARSAPPAHVAYAASFDSYVVLTWNPASPPAADERTRCAATAKLLRGLSTVKGQYTFHPYAVTPYHDDYLHHFDLAEAARHQQQRPREGETSGAGGKLPALRIKARGRLAEAITLGGGRPVEGEWDVALAELSLGELLESHATQLGGWIGPPWLKQGWFHAYLLHAPLVSETGARRTIDDAYRRRALAGTESLADRLNLERQLVSLLGRGCERAVVGYTLRRQALNVDYSEGIENLGVDAQGGIGSAIFLRTVKLKDFPWNGWLRLGAHARPGAAWNPIGGFDDETGRVIWAALGDAAVLPAPQSGSWLPNRVWPAGKDSVDGHVEMPGGTLVPDASGAALRPVGRGTTANAKLTYRVLASAFHDGTRVGPADLLYPFVFAYRWSGKDGSNTGTDPVVERATALLRGSLAGVRVVKVDTEIKAFGEAQLTYEVPQIDVYLSRAPAERDRLAVAPPWSPVPWQLIALMEEAVARGFAAFSEAEAKRRGIAWLDLVRDRKLNEKLVGLVDGFERRAWVPEALRGLVTVPQARQRWAALRRFYRQHGHFLVTNGPYRLEKWSPESVVLSAFRDLSYPLGVGSFDQHPLPLRAFVTAVERRGERLALSVDVETVVKFERSHRIEREPFRPAPSGEKKTTTLVAHYAVLSASDEVLAAGASEEVESGKLVIDLRDKLRPGADRLLVALVLNENWMNPEVKVVPYRTGA